MIQLNPSTRLLISFDLSLKCVERLSLVQRTIEASAPREGRFRWEDPSEIRADLIFLSDLDPSATPLVIQAISDSIAPLYPFEIKVERVFAGPDRYRPRYFYAGMDDVSAEVISLIRIKIERELSEFGLVLPKQRFVPSIFLGRGLSNFDSKRSLKRVRDLAISTSLIRHLTIGELPNVSLPPRTSTYSPARVKVLKRFTLGVRS